MNGVRRLGPLAATALFTGCAALLAGCGASVRVGENQTLDCRSADGNEPTTGVLLLAQSVPTAQWVPCVEPGPLGWTLGDLHAERGSARFWLVSDRYDPHSIEVRLTPSCDTTGATSIPSEHEGMRRYERVQQVSPKFIATRSYVFEGGCISVLFKIDGERAEPLGAATQRLGVRSRDDLSAYVRADSGGRLELDPP